MSKKMKFLVGCRCGAHYQIEAIPFVDKVTEWICPRCGKNDVASYKPQHREGRK
jgi:hypothetical protein